MLNIYPRQGCDTYRKNDSPRDVRRKSSYQRDTASGEGTVARAHSDDAVPLRMDVDRWPKGNELRDVEVMSDVPSLGAAY